MQAVKGGSLDDLILEGFVQLGKVGAVTGHPDDQGAVFGRMGLGLAQGFG